MQIPIEKIEAHALPRDRKVIDADAQKELAQALAAFGLRTPIEVFETTDGFGLISGYRRLMAAKTLGWSDIEAKLLHPDNTAAALAAMVEENEVRQNLSPWERASIAVAAQAQGHFETIDAAVLGLFPQASRQKRAKLRAMADVVDALDGLLVDPETLSERKLTRIAGVLTLGWQDLIEATLEDAETAETQWQLLDPVLREAETCRAENKPTHPQHPKRLSHPYRGVKIRRERTRNGFLLHITGQGATDPLVSDVLDNIETMFGTP